MTLPQAVSKWLMSVNQEKDKLKQPHDHRSHPTAQTHAFLSPLPADMTKTCSHKCENTPSVSAKHVVLHSLRNRIRLALKTCLFLSQTHSAERTRLRSGSQLTWEKEGRKAGRQGGGTSAFAVRSVSGGDTGVCLCALCTCGRERVERNAAVGSRNTSLGNDLAQPVAAPPRYHGLPLSPGVTGPWARPGHSIQ